MDQGNSTERTGIMDYDQQAHKLESARELFRGEWDEEGTVSVHLPRAEAFALLTVKGWTIPADLRVGKDPFIAPDGEICWEIGEALAIALCAEGLLT